MKKIIHGTTFNYREGTNDEGIIHYVFEENAYDFPGDLSNLIVIDIGGHIGTASILAARRGARVFVYEPGAANYSLLEQNIKDNHFEQKITALQLGVGLPGKKKLYIDSENTGQNTTFLDINEFPHITTEDITVVSFASVLSDNKIVRCDLLKLDCEGAEREILDEIIAGLHKQVTQISLEIIEDADRYIALLEEFYTIKKLRNFEYLLTHI